MFDDIVGTVNSPIVTGALLLLLGVILNAVRNARKEAKRERAEAARLARQQASDLADVKTALIGKPATPFEKAEPGLIETVEQLSAAVMADTATRALYEGIRTEMNELNAFVSAWRDVWNRNVHRAREAGMADIEDAPPFPRRKSD